MDGGAAQAGQRVELVPEDDVALVARPVDDGQVPARRRQVLEERPQRRDADPAGDEQGPAGASAGAGQHPVRALDEDARAEAEVAEGRSTSRRGP